MLSGWTLKDALEEAAYLAEEDWLKFVSNRHERSD
jgi:hypothetical protein